MSQQTRTVLILGAVLGAVLAYKVITGQLHDTFQDIATIWNYLF